MSGWWTAFSFGGSRVDRAICWKGYLETHKELERERERERVFCDLSQHGTSVAVKSNLETFRFTRLL